MAGVFLGSLVIPRASDIVGRKPIFMSGVVSSMFMLVACLYCTNLHLMYALCFFQGIAEYARYSVGYIYLVEFFPKKGQDTAGVSFFLMFGACLAYVAIQFWVVTKNWQANVYIAIALSMLSLPCGLWIPESPRFYYAQMQFDQTRAVLKQISAINNGGKPTLFTFKTEVELATGSNDECTEGEDLKRQFKHQLNQSLNSSMQHS